MKIIIDLMDMYTTLLGKWASVGRTIDSAINACDIVTGHATADSISDHDIERSRVCSDELVALKQPIDSLHRTARETIWQIQRARVVKQEECTLGMLENGKQYRGFCPFKTDFKHELLLSYLVVIASRPDWDRSDIYWMLNTDWAFDNLKQYYRDSALIEPIFTICSPHGGLEPHEL